MRLHPLVGLRLITCLRLREDGQALVEWAVIIGAGAALLIVGMLFLGGKVDHLYRNIDSGPPATLTPPVAQCDSNYAGGCIPPYTRPRLWGPERSRHPTSRSGHGS